MHTGVLIDFLNIRTNRHPINLFCSSPDMEVLPVLFLMKCLFVIGRCEVSHRIQCVRQVLMGSDWNTLKEELKKTCGLCLYKAQEPVRKDNALSVYLTTECSGIFK